MYYSNSLLRAMEADKLLAIKLEKALSGVKDDVFKHAKMIGDGATRLSYYTSCFTDNYQDVCSRLQHEDVRFIKALIQLIKDRNIIFKMISIYIDCLLQNKSIDRIQHIQTLLLRLGITVSSSMLTSQALVYSITEAICTGVHTHAWLKAKTGTLSTYSVFFLKLYGLVEEASKSANLLKSSHPYYYNALYHNELEMMFFIIEPIILQSSIFNPASTSDNDIAYAISRMIKG